MKQLRELQQNFMAFIEAKDGAILDRLHGPDAAWIDGRLDIYYQAYRIRLEDALRDNFPAVHFVLGDDHFSALSAAYFAWRRPVTFSLRDVGDALVEYLSANEPYSEQPVLADLARFEWALRYAYDAADARHLDLGDLRAVAPEQWPNLSFKLHPSVRLLALRCNAVEVWQAFSASQDLPTPRCGEADVIWAVWRRDLRTYFRSLNPQQAWLANRLADGAEFVEICAGMETLCATDAAATVAGYLNKFIDDGWLSALSVQEGSSTDDSFT